jgi:hypothetical protein
VKQVTRWLTAAALGSTLLVAASPLASAGAVAPERGASSTAQASARPTAVPATRAITPVSPRLSAAELTQWKQLVATAEGREQVVSQLQTAFAGVAQVQASAPSTAAAVRPDLATGITGDHFWIIASYADIADGAIWAGVRACQTRLPAWLCTEAGNLLTSWASGWGAANNHGVWAAIYWWPPHITGGRW